MQRAEQRVDSAKEKIPRILYLMSLSLVVVVGVDYLIPGKWRRTQMQQHEDRARISKHALMNTLDLFLTNFTLCLPSPTNLSFRCTTLRIKGCIEYMYVCATYGPHLILKTITISFKLVSGWHFKTYLFLFTLFDLMFWIITALLYIFLASYSGVSFRAGLYYIIYQVFKAFIEKPECH